MKLNKNEIFKANIILSDINVNCVCKVSFASKNMIGIGYYKENVYAYELIYGVNEIEYLIDSLTVKYLECIEKIIIEEW